MTTLVERKVIGNTAFTIKKIGGVFDTVIYVYKENDIECLLRAESYQDVEKFFSTLHPPGNFRYPTSIHWGADYAHGFKYVTADNACHAELIIFRRSNGTAKRENIQIKMENGTFRFTTQEDYV